MKASEWITVGALILGPILAVRISEYLQRGREKRDRQLDLYRRLMSTRKAGLSGAHVEALNLIDVDFKGKRRIQNAWKAYLDHLNTSAENQEAWNTRQEDLLVELLYEMGSDLGYAFDKTHIRRAFYYPRGHGEADVAMLTIRQALVEIFAKRKGFPVEIVAPSEPVPAAEKDKADRQP